MSESMNISIKEAKQDDGCDEKMDGYLTRTPGDVLWSQVEKSVYKKLHNVIILWCSHY